MDNRENSSDGQIVSSAPLWEDVYPYEELSRATSWAISSIEKNPTWTFDKARTAVGDIEKAIITHLTKGINYIFKKALIYTTDYLGLNPDATVVTKLDGSNKPLSLYDFYNKTLGLRDNRGKNDYAPISINLGNTTTQIFFSPNPTLAISQKHIELASLGVHIANIELGTRQPGSPSPDSFMFNISFACQVRIENGNPIVVWMKREKLFTVGNDISTTIDKIVNRGIRQISDAEKQEIEILYNAMGLGRRQ